MATSVRLLSGVALTFAACGGGTTETTPPPVAARSAPPPQPMPATANGLPDPVSLEESCPADVPGVHVTYAETADGAALSFVAPPHQVDEVRRRVHRMTADHPRFVIDADDPPLDAVEPDLVSTTHEVDLIENGARLVIRPVSHADLESVRSHARRHADVMARGLCLPPIGPAQG